jgi:hypothetical protein
MAYDNKKILITFLAIGLLSVLLFLMFRKKSSDDNSGYKDSKNKSDPKSDPQPDPKSDPKSDPDSKRKPSPMPAPTPAPAPVNPSPGCFSPECYLCKNLKPDDPIQDRVKCMKCIYQDKDVGEADCDMLSQDFFDDSICGNEYKQFYNDKNCQQWTKKDSKNICDPDCNQSDKNIACYENVIRQNQKSFYIDSNNNKIEDPADVCRQECTEGNLGISPCATLCQNACRKVLSGRMPNF